MYFFSLESVKTENLLKESYNIVKNRKNWPILGARVV